LTALDRFTLQQNNLDRIASNNNARIPAALTNWFNNTIAVTSRQNQGDITPPIIAGTGTITWQVT
jgi:hypothetical protein